jgi:hypothetical protein
MRANANPWESRDHIVIVAKGLFYESLQKPQIRDASKLQIIEDFALPDLVPEGVLVLRV